MKTTTYMLAVAAVLSLPILFTAASTASAADRFCTPMGCGPNGHGSHVAVVFRGPIPLPFPVIVTANGPDCRDRREIRHERRHARQIARHDRHERRHDRRDAHRWQRYEDSRWRDTGHRW